MNQSRVVQACGLCLKKAFDIARADSLRKTRGSLDVEIYRIQRSVSGNIERFAVGSAETAVGAAGLGNEDFAKQLAPRRKALHAVPSTGPDVALNIATKAIGSSRR